MRDVNKPTVVFLALLFLSVSHVMSVAHAQEAKQQLSVATTYPTIYVSLGDQFTLHQDQSAIIKDEDLEIKVKRFYNSPCARCTWYGVGVAFQYSHAGEVQSGINLCQAFGHKVATIASDHESYVTLKVEKIDQQMPERVATPP